MSEMPQAPRPQPWLGPVVVVLLAGQLGLIWVQGGLLHRQHQAIQGLREDIRGLAETIEQGDGIVSEAEEDGFVPARRQSARQRASLARAAHISLQDEQTEQATRDLEEARKSAEKAVQEARETQAKLSFEENARKAEEKAKIEKAQSTGQKWIWIGLAAGLVALVVRSWLRRRG